MWRKGLISRIYTSRGDFITTAGEPEKALKYYAKALALSPANAVTYRARGCTYTVMGELNKAMKAYYEEAGIWEDRRWIGGYELGIAFPPDWIGVWYYEAENETDERVICPGTVFNYESQIYLPLGAGLSNVIDTIETDEIRCRIMSKFPPDLIIVET